MQHPLSIWLRSISFMLMLASCTPVVDTRGHNLEEADFSQIIPGQSSPEDVQAILGSPSATSTYGDITWYYISERKETSGFHAAEVADQKVVSITFDTDKKVSEVKDYAKQDGKPVDFVRKETPTEGHEMTIMEQMLGNFGRFNAPGRAIDPKTLRR